MILRRTIIVLLVCFATTILLILTQLVYAGAKGYAVLTGIFGSSLIALLVWSQKNDISNWSERQQFSPRVLFVFLGLCGAAVVEIIFWVAERVFNTSGVAASPDLLVDLLVTMP